MSIKYRLSKKKNRLNRRSDGLWYATAAPGYKFGTRDLCRYASMHTTLGHFEVRAVLDLLGQCVPMLLAEGNVVQLGELGTLRVTFGSEGVEQPEDFHPRLMRPARIVFYPSKALKAAMRSHLSYEAGGLVDEGIAFGSIASWRRYRGEAE